MKKVIAILVAALICVTVFAACSKPATDETTEAASEAETLASDFAGKTLVMGSSCDFPPYESIGEDGSYVGIDIDIAKAICAKLGATLEVKDMDFNGIIAAVETGAVSFGMSGMTITEARKESVNFSTPYETAVQVILVKEGSEIKSADDLEGKKIGVQAGTTGDDYATEDFGQDAVAQYTKYALAIQALINDQVDCCILDEPTAKAFAAENEGLTVLETAYATEEYAVAFNKADTALLDAWNAAFDAIKADGTVDAIFAAYAEEEEAEDETAEAAEETEAEAEETAEAVEETEEAAEETTAA